MTPLRLFWILLGLLPVVAGQAWADDPPEGRFQGFPGYPGASDMQFEGALKSNDVPLDATVVVTPDPIKAVIDHYRRHLESMHIAGTEHWLGPGTAYIGFFDPLSRTMRLVTTVGTPSGGTMVIFSSMDPRNLFRKPGLIPADLPSIPGASRVATTESRDGPHRHRTVHFLLEGKTPGQAREEVTRALSLQGWKPAPDVVAGEGNTVFSRGRSWCIVRISPAEEGQSVTMMVTDRMPQVTKSGE